MADRQMLGGGPPQGIPVLSRGTRTWSVPPDWWRPCWKLRPHFSLIELQPQNSLPAGVGHEKIDSLRTAGSMIFIHLHALPSRRRPCPPNPPILQRRLAGIPPPFFTRPVVPGAWCLVPGVWCSTRLVCRRKLQAVTIKQATHAYKKPRRQEEGSTR